MVALYEIQLGVGHQEHSVKVFSDRVVIQKAKITLNSSNFGALKELFKHLMQILGKKFETFKSLNNDYIGIDAKFSEIEEVELKLATSRFLNNGMITFYLKGKPKKKVTLFNYKDAENAIIFTSKYNDKAQQIKNYVDNMINKK